MLEEAEAHSEYEQHLALKEVSLKWTATATNRMYKNCELNPDRGKLSSFFQGS